MSAADSAKRIADVLIEKPKGFRGPKGEQMHAEVMAADVIACANAIGKTDARAQMMAKGCRAVCPDEVNPRILVTIQADDAHHLVDSMPVAEPGQP